MVAQTVVSVIVATLELTQAPPIVAFMALSAFLTIANLTQIARLVSSAIPIKISASQVKVVP